MADDDEWVFYGYSSNSCKDHYVGNQKSEQELRDGPECNATLFRGVEDRNKHKYEDREEQGKYSA